LKTEIREFIKAALDEDVGDGDHTSIACIDANAVGKAIVRMKEAGVIAGITVAKEILNYIDGTIEIKALVSDGDEVQNGQEIIKIEGNVRNILKSERLLLNVMQRMSGIATKTKRFVKLIEGTNAKILDTRKTTPNFRFFEKWAVRIGGGHNHRFGLYDMILIKDNHITACGGVEKAIKAVNNYLQNLKLNLSVEIETRTIDEVNEVLQYGDVNRIMLDNFSIKNLKEAVLLINHRYETEASGGITENNIREVAETGVDFISMGALTHSYKSLDINMKITR
jgi:nicotinate-nucleotide pyrophosphorylase (carboxylating)